MKILLLGIALLPAFGQTISQKERDSAVEMLRTSRELFLRSVEHLSEAQWNFEPGPFRWSIGECAEHVVATEDLYLQTLTKLLESPPPGTPEPKLSDDELLKIYTDRSLKRNTSPQLQPRGKWASRSEMFRHFNQTRERVIAIAMTTQARLRDHRSRAAYGNLMDGYQWFLRFAGHCERHTAQIDEVKRHLNFPKE